MLEGEIGYGKNDLLTRNVKEVAEAYKELTKDKDIKGLVFDLAGKSRGTPK